MLVGARAAEHEMGMAIDQARSDPCAAERNDFRGAKPGELGALADADYLALGNADRAIVDQPKRVARHLFERRDPAIDEQPVPHARRLRRAAMLASKRWQAGPTFPTWSLAWRRGLQSG